ncbi:MAG: hypothetical protein LBV80_08760 [Deltaproteobacteria bacterium]|jgi:hypothetical protein|nr:hypothetical protein [Deltaproteobacteria bacterium]
MNHLLKQLSEALLSSPSLDPAGAGDQANSAGSGTNCYDPEMLYVECRKCGNPIMWEPGRTTAILARSCVSPALVDEHCMIISDGCRNCSPHADVFALSIVRLASISAQDLLLMHSTGGNA